MLGVLETGFALDSISNYLGGLPIGRNGQIFIIDRAGQLIASSSESVLRRRGDEFGRVLATESADEVARGAAHRLLSRAPDLSTLDAEITFRFNTNRARVFVSVEPLQFEDGPDWLVVVAVSDSDFMAHVDANQRTVLLACAAVIFVSVLLGLAVVRFIATPLIELARKAKLIQRGDLNIAFSSRSNDEIGVLADTLGEMVVGLRERKYIRDAFGRYVSPEVVDRILGDPEGLELGGKLQTVTILMSDLRGFSVLSARLEPPEMVTLLNRYLSAMTEVITQYNGMINEFIGDAIMVLFGPPRPRADDADRAVRCAVQMQIALSEFNRANVDFGQLELEMGIGVNTGEVIVGNIGSNTHVKYGAVGDAVNMTARVESLTVGGQVLIADATRKQLSQGFDLTDPIQANVKGHAEPLVVFGVEGVAGGPQLNSASLSMDELDNVEISARLQRLIKKSQSGAALSVRVVQMGARGLVFLTDANFRSLEDVKITLTNEDGSPDADQGWYAKVAEVETFESGTRVQLIFTSVVE